MNFLLKLLIRFFGAKIYVIENEKYKMGEISRWLHAGNSKGWREYYRFRRSSMLSLLGLGQGRGRDYWKTVGKLEELEVLNGAIAQEAADRKFKEKVEQEKEVVRRKVFK